MEQHTQLLLMNTHKSGDFYAEYSGVSMADLLDDSDVLQSASGITVFAPDGWAQYHPLAADIDPLMYHVYGEYPAASFYYDQEADKNFANGWCDYGSFAVEDLEHGDEIEIDNGLQLLVALKRDEEYLKPGELTSTNKLDGEGPFRVVPPQKIPGPPDQSVKSAHQDVIWPFDETADHNAGFATRSATIIRVEPLPQGTTDIDTLEAGWNYVDEKKILIYGAIDPLETQRVKLKLLLESVHRVDKKDFKYPLLKHIVIRYLFLTKRFILKSKEQHALFILDKLTDKVNGCNDSGAAENDDWITDCDSQAIIYWASKELEILLSIKR